MIVPPALLSHESTEHYTPQYILDAVIACMSAIDLDPCSNSREIPNVPAARHYTAQDNGLVQPWVGAGISQSPVRTRCRAVVFKIILGAVRRLDYRGNCAVEVGDRDCCVEDIDGDIMSGLLSFG